jgi:hypothetical protein
MNVMILLTGIRIGFNMNPSAALTTLNQRGITMKSFAKAVSLGLVVAALAATTGCQSMADHNDQVRAANAASPSYQAAHEMDVEGATKPWHGTVVGWNDNNQS